QFITKANRLAVYKYLFTEGVLVAQKDFYKPKHEEIEDVPNLEVLNLMKSLKSRGYVRETFSWQYYYYYLTDEGIEYLRKYLHLPEEIVPATLKKAAARPARAGPTPGKPHFRKRAFCSLFRGRRFGDKKLGPDGNFEPRFEGGQDGYRRGGGFGRGSGERRPE
ncbi:unnamed protein product, partial [Phaeothamnion confervicola]